MLLCRSCVPVDCHCLQIAQRHLLRGKDAATGKVLSAALYQKIVDRFHEVFGKEGAGWAFMTLFVAELSDFRRPPTTQALPTPAPPAPSCPTSLRPVSPASHLSLRRPLAASRRLDQPEAPDERATLTAGSAGSPHFHFPPSPGTRGARAPSGRPSTSGQGLPATPPPKKAKRRRAVAPSAPTVPEAPECSTPIATRRSSRRTGAHAASPYFVGGRC